MQKDVVLAVGSVKTTLRDTEGYFTVLAQQWKKKKHGHPSTSAKISGNKVMISAQMTSDI